MYRILLLLVTLLSLSACLSSAPRNPGNACEIFEDRRAWFRAAADAEKRWGVPISVSMAFIYQESAFRSRAKPARTRILWVIPGPRPSNAYGYAQALESTWNEYREVTGNRRAKRSDFADAVDFIGWYNANSYRRNNIALHDARNLYLAYHEGNTGFARATYADKPWLLDTAARVQSNAERYQAQIDRCADELGKNWWQRLLF
ncbi:MAG: transglycosylase SLT domain-containing protein [Pseudomonadales bacterium]|nr:transglycosylase SLT domain-containing protein [Pseudomonadales bacterium]MCP5331034.1 transglycosylase SLT domain-containing protein [Pseudomonadales bacterium]MCP5343496.1 transglycosylase SLT domain-containing protein [Pseudomonadales bacterium]